MRSLPLVYPGPDPDADLYAVKEVKEIEAVRERQAGGPTPR